MIKQNSGIVSDLKHNARILSVQSSSYPTISRCRVSKIVRVWYTRMPKTQFFGVRGDNQSVKFFDNKVLYFSLPKLCSDKSCHERSLVSSRVEVGSVSVKSQKLNLCSFLTVVSEQLSQPQFSMPIKFAGSRVAVVLGTILMQRL